MLRIQNPGTRHLAMACGIALCLLAANANALFIVNQPWVKPARSGQTTEVYMNLTSTDGATLVAVRSDAAATVIVRGPGRKPATIDRLPLPAKVLVALAPGREHIALVRLAKIVKLGERVALTLTIEDSNGGRQEIPVDAEARMRSPEDDERRAHGHHPN